MKRFITAPLASAGAICLALIASASASASTIDWNVRTAQSADTSVANTIAITNISQAQALLNSNSADLNGATAQYPTINFNLPDNPSAVLFPGTAAFPGIPTTNELNFAAEATATINIPTAGVYTFGVNSDDGFTMTVGTNSMQFLGLRAAKSTYSTFTFSQPGAYPVDVVYFQHLGAADLEVFATPGSFTTFGQAGSNFQLVGDSLHGGLSLFDPNASLPEPSPCLLTIPLAFGLLLRRPPAF